MDYKKEIEELNIEIELLRAFISSKGLDIELDDFTDKYMDNSLNKDSEGLYWYSYRLRGFSLGCQPKGHIKVNHEIGRHGIIAYNRPLTDTELSEYELEPFTQLEKVS